MATPKMMGQLDTAQTARQPQEVDPDDEVFGQMVAALRQHVFGKGEKGIVDRMQQADDPGRVLGEIVFALVRETAHQVEEAGQELVWDVLIGVATEVIDDIVEMLAAYDIAIDDKGKEYALLFAQQLYVESGNPTQEERQAAQQQLGEFKQTGELDQAVSYVQQRGTEAGVDPFGVNTQPPGMMGQE